MDSLNNQIPQLVVGQQCQTDEEYFIALRQWVQDGYLWQSFNSYFPYYLMLNQAPQSINPPAPTRNGFTGFPSISNFFSTRRIPSTSGGLNNNPNITIQTDINNNTVRGVRITGTTCRVPPFWKRLAAEAIDFFLLLILKFMITFVIVNYVDFLDFTELHQTQTLDMKTIYALSQEIIVLESFYRLVVILYEAFCLAYSPIGDGMGGSSIGKSLYKLRVIKADNIVYMQNNNIVVYPGTDLGFANSLARSVMKNVHLVFMIPISYFFFFFPYNRTGYDMLAKSIVVEEPVNRT